MIKYTYSVTNMQDVVAILEPKSARKGQSRLPSSVEEMHRWDCRKLPSPE